jgi:pyridoxamine 5'-phosphate oxidase
VQPALFANPPADPLPLVAEWLEAAADVALKNPHAMALATADAEGRPSVRMVLLKGFAALEGYAVFFTNYGSRKAREIAANDRAAAVLYWERLGRQIRFEGRLRRSPEQESDAYFRTRPRASRINAWASRQSAVLRTFSELEDRIDSQTARFAGSDAIPRPEFWGGYRLWVEAVELWLEGVDRYHERVRYERRLAAAPDAAFFGGPWRRQLLQP